MGSRYDRLSIQDQNNFWVETPDTPMHIVAVLQNSSRVLSPMRVAISNWTTSAGGSRSAWTEPPGYGRWFDPAAS